MNLEFIIPILFVIIVGVLFIKTVVFSSKNVIKNAFKNSRKRSINTIKKNEYVKIIGHTKPTDAPLTAPLSGKTCVYYNVIIDVKDKKNWRRIINDTKSHGFYIDDNTETAFIDRNAFNIKTSLKHIINTYKINATPKNNNNLKDYLKQQTTNKKRLTTNKTLRCRESIIKVDEKIGVKGIANWITLDQKTKKFSYSKMVTLTGTAKEKLLITNDSNLLTRAKRQI